MNPFEAFMDWLNKMPKVEQEDVAYFASPLGFSDKALSDSDDLIQSFIEYLSPADPSYRLATKLIAVRACIDFFLIRKRGDSKEWNETKRMMSAIQRRVEAEGDDRGARRYQDMLDKMPFREKQWLRFAKSWRALCDGPLSDEAFEWWLRPQ